MDLDGKIWVKCIDFGWKFHAFCVIPFNDNLLDFEQETLDHLELQGFFHMLHGKVIFILHYM